MLVECGSTKSEGKQKLVISDHQSVPKTKNRMEMLAKMIEEVFTVISHRRSLMRHLLYVPEEGPGDLREAKKKRCRQD